MHRWLALALTLLCADPARAATVVRFETPLGDFDVELYDDVAPEHVENFLRYLRDGRYANSFIHRSARIVVTQGQPAVPFVIQGGGFTYDADLGPFVFGQGLRAVPSYPAITNDHELSNVRGTIAMARTQQVNSATNQWFINLRDNGGAPANLDTQNEGFTVFGRVLEPGMPVVDHLAEVVRWNASVIHPALGELPLIDFVQNTPIGEQHLVYTAVTELPEPAASALGAAALLAALVLTARRRGADRRP